MNSHASGGARRGPRPLATSVCRRLEALYRNDLRVYRRELLACRMRMSRRTVHALRTAIRRLLICLALVGVERDEPAGMRTLLRRQLKALGGARDAQVQLQLVKGAVAPIAPGLEALGEHLRRRRRRRMKEAGRALESDKILRRLGGWSPGLEPGSARMVPRLRIFVDGKLHAAIDSLSSFAGAARADEAARHRTRTLSRECCYIVEALRPCWRGAGTERLLSKLRSFQQSVGQVHDRELLLGRIGRLTADARLESAPLRPFSEALQSEKARRMKACSRSEWRLVLETLLARGELGSGSRWSAPGKGGYARGAAGGSFWTASLPD
jgi:CHAD domain-containing protein